jgi:hypothetical protein
MNWRRAASQEDAENIQKKLVRARKDTRRWKRVALRLAQAVEGNEGSYETEDGFVASPVAYVLAAALLHPKKRAKKSSRKR